MSDLGQYLIAEYTEDYRQGRITRRDALRRIAAITGSLALATTALAGCTPTGGAGSTPATGATTPTGGGTPAATPTVRAGAAIVSTPTMAAGTPAPLAIIDQRLEIPHQGNMLIAYLTRPQTGGPYPIVLVCHENRGLTDHIKDVTRRAATAGYVAVAVDLLYRQGGTDRITDPAVIAAALGRDARPDDFVADFQAALNYVKSQPYARADRVGMVGFCFGGGITWRVATKTPELRAAVPFYGPNPPLEDVPGIRAAVLAIYGENDANINRGIPAIEEAMKANGKIFEKIIYSNAGHAFHNDTGANYNPEAARDAWAKTLAWFERYLKA